MLLSYITSVPGDKGYFASVLRSRDHPDLLGQPWRRVCNMTELRCLLLDMCCTVGSQTHNQKIQSHFDLFIRLFVDSSQRMNLTLSINFSESRHSYHGCYPRDGNRSPWAGVDYMLN